MKKSCLQCGTEFARPEGAKDYDWERRRFCAPRCYGNWSYLHQSSRRKEIAARPTLNDLVNGLLLVDQARILPNDARYAASRDGSIFSRSRIGNWVGPDRWRRLRFATVKAGYKRVSLGHRDASFVHELVALAFIGPRPFRGAQIRHLDGNPSNNCVDNLAYGTAKENGADKVAHGRSPRGRKQHLNKLGEDQVREIRRLAEGRIMFQRAIARQFGVTQTTVRDIMTRRSWGWLDAEG